MFFEVRPHKEAKIYLTASSKGKQLTFSKKMCLEKVKTAFEGSSKKGEVGWSNKWRPERGETKD